MKIPSVISYSLKSQNREQQWGTDLSPQAIAMVHTKLQLDVDDTAAELNLILQALDGMHNLNFQYIKESGGAPKYTRKGPEQIVEDYLTKVFNYLLQAVESFTEELRSSIPVDIVATIPAVRSCSISLSYYSDCISTRIGVTEQRIPLFEHLHEPDSIKRPFRS